MFGLPRNVDLSFFVDRAVSQVCFGAHDLILNFSDELSVSVTSLIEFKDAKGEAVRSEDFREVASALVSLIDRTVVSVNGEMDGTLDLIFDNGARLSIFDRYKQYESYVIKHRETLIVV